VGSVFEEEGLAYRQGMAKALVALILSSVILKYHDSVKNRSYSLESASCSLLNKKAPDWVLFCFYPFLNDPRIALTNPPKNLGNLIV
jgi:hypothetical protein